MAQFDIGTDLGGLSDFNQSVGDSWGRLALAEALGRRYITPRGSLIGCPNYGYDLRQFLSAPLLNVGELTWNVEAEAMKDVRVERARARVAVSGGAKSIYVKLDIQGLVGVFPLELLIAASGIQFQLAA